MAVSNEIRRCRRCRETPAGMITTLEPCYSPTKWHPVEPFRCKPRNGSDPLTTNKIGKGSRQRCEDRDLAIGGRVGGEEEGGRRGGYDGRKRKGTEEREEAANEEVAGELITREGGAPTRVSEQLHQGVRAM
ncbi:hypothetical protein GW17_00034129 [Ensete ventricosum]|nr:hypothetical protein GW17_00034129 [Ensete ventricosum]